MNPYKAAVAAHINALLATGMTQREVAALLKYEHANNVSMLLNDRYPTYVLSPLKLPLLQRACHLTAGEAYALFRCLMSTATGASKVVNLDLGTLDWLESLILSCKPTQNAQETRHA